MEQAFRILSKKMVGQLPTKGEEITFLLAYLPSAILRNCWKMLPNERIKPQRGSHGIQLIKRKKGISRTMGRVVPG